MIHAFRLFDTNIVADVNSGAVHVLDDICFDVINAIDQLKEDKESAALPEVQAVVSALQEKYAAVDIAETYEEVKELVAAGQLYSEDIYKDYLPLWERKSDIKALCLHISHDCNLRCKYCFADTGAFGGERRSREGGH